MSGRRSGLRLVRSALADSGPALLALGGWTVLAAAPAVASGKALALAVDHGFLAHRPDAAWRWLVLFAAAAVLSAWATRRSYGPLARIVEPARDRLLVASAAGLLHRATASRGRATGATALAVAQVTRQVEAVRDTLAGQLLLVAHLVLTVAAVVTGTAVLAPAAVLPVAGPLLLALAAFATLTPRTARRQRELFATEEDIARSALHTVTALRDLVACGAERTALARVLADVAANEAAGRALARLAATRHLLVALGVHGPLVAVVLAAPTLIAHGMTTGALLGVLAYLLGTLEPALRLLVQGLGPSWIRLTEAATRLAATASMPEGPSGNRSAKPPPPREPHPGEARPGESREKWQPAAAVPQVDLRLLGVRFSYGPAAEPVLRDFDLDLGDGESVAVVGPSGIGKSTLADLAAGVLPPDQGRVLLAGVRADRLPAAELARLRVLLPQEPYVFTGPLADNLRWLAPHHSPAAVTDALHRLGAEHLTDRRGGLDGEISAATLSPGERQLVALVRAYLSPARLVILDEATSHLDAVAERRVDHAFRHRPGSLLTVTHRAGPAEHADRVVYLDGTSWHVATHRDLLAERPDYRRLLGVHPETAPNRTGSTRNRR
ncbi:ABC transporter ATP-binding protein [Kitasatospora sp. NPDC049285]|uniref:ABC transporter ATP-binding protein n=1 Tax=Kitasatospora sp. NPDC049285 TaxID=3157096 RepID=UPI003425D9C6